MPKAARVLVALKRDGWVQIRQRGSYRPLVKGPLKRTWGFHDGMELGTVQMTQVASNSAIRRTVKRPPTACDDPDRTTLEQVRGGNRLADSAVNAHLTPRQREVLQLVADGMPHHSIAARLGISVATLREILKGLRAKPRKGPPGSPPPSAVAIVT